MKRILLPLFALLLTPNGAGASEPLRLEHYAPIPCTVACGYWDAAGAAGFSACNSFPPGSYDQTVIRFTEPTGVIQITTHSVVDYDTFVCTMNDESLQVGCTAFSKCVSIGDECDHVLGVSLIASGCVERISLTWQALQAANFGTSDQFRLVSSNWSDFAPLPITISGPAEIVDDTFEASVI